MDEGDSMSIKKMIEWSPRFFSVLLMILLFMFSLDVLEMDATWYEILLGLLIHNIPVMILAIVLVVAWHKALIGALVYSSLGIVYILWMLFDQGISQWLAMLSLGLPSIIIGILYYIHHKLL